MEVLTLLTREQLLPELVPTGSSDPHTEPNESSHRPTTRLHPEENTLEGSGVASRVWPAKAERGSDLFDGLVLRGGCAVVRVLLRAGVGALADLPALLVLVRQLLHVPVGLAAAQPPHRARQPLAQRVARALGARGALGPHHVGLKGGHRGRRAGIVTGDGE